MNNFGFIRVAAVTPAIKLASPADNAAEICTFIEKLSQQGVSIAVFPELALTGVTCGDLFLQHHLIKGAEAGIERICQASKDKGTVIFVGTPALVNGRLYNCAAVIYDGALMGLVPKVATGKNDIFASGAGLETEVVYAGGPCLVGPDILFEIGGTTAAVVMGKDYASPSPLSSQHALNGAEIIINLSSEVEVLLQDKFRHNMLACQSARVHGAYIHVSSGCGESTTDHVYAGSASIWEDGKCLIENQRFNSASSTIIADIDTDKIKNRRVRCEEFRESDSGDYGWRVHVADSLSTDFDSKLYRQIEPHPFVPENELDYRCREILDIQVAALKSRLSHINCKTAVIGISGGLDSTLALLVTTLAYDSIGWSRDRIIGVTMPGYGTTARTRNNASDLMEALGISSKEISIVAACDRHFMDIGHDSSIHDVTYENSQARERTQILMDLANQTGGLVIGTGDLSELALGWATYNGDHMSMYGVNAGVPKTLVRSLVAWAAKNRFQNDRPEGLRPVKDILMDIVDTPISPELLPADENGKIKQVTEDLVGPYELHDFFIYHFIRNGYSPEKILFLAKKAFEGTYDEDIIQKWLKTFLRRFFNQQFKRSCLPDGPAVGTVSLSPRAGWKMPSDAFSTLFTDSLE